MSQEMTSQGMAQQFQCPTMLIIQSNKMRMQLSVAGMETLLVDDGKTAWEYIAPPVNYLKGGHRS